MDIVDQIRAASIQSAGDISGYPDIQYIHQISQPLADLQSALGAYSLDPDTDLGVLTVRQLYQKYFDIAIAVGDRDNPD